MIGAPLIFNIIQAVFFPNLLAPPVEEIQYSRFLELLDEGHITAIEIDEQTARISFEVTDNAKPSGTAAYFTGLCNDPDLFNRLLDHKTADGNAITFTQIIPEQPNFLLALSP